MRRKKLILIMPNFYLYANEIMNELEEKGYEVYKYNEEPPRTAFLIIKKLGSLFHTDIGYKIVNVVLWNRIKKQIKECEYLIVIRGNILEKKLIDNIKRMLPDENNTIYYTWDSAIYLKHQGALAECFHRAYSFDRKDIEVRKKYEHLPLFYLPEYERGQEEMTNVLEYDLCCIAGFFPFRYQELLKVISQNPNLKILIKLYIDKKLFEYKKRTEQWYSEIDEKYLIFEPMDTEEIVALCNKSRAILDITDEKQSGLSMRTIEAVGLRKKLVTNNCDIKYYDIYSEDNIYLVGADNSYKINEGWLEQEYSLPEDIQKSYSLGQWTDILLGNRETPNHIVCIQDS